MPLGHPLFGQLVPCEACGHVIQLRVARFDKKSSRRGRALEQFFQNFSFEGSAENALEAYNAAVAFASDPTGWLVIHGPKGNGKSHLAAAIANHLIETRHIPTLFLTAPDLLEALRDAIRASVRGLPGQLPSLLDSARRAPVLILDDLGAEYQTAWAQEQIFLLLDHRYRLKVPTVVITNEALDSLPARIYSRLGDRALSKVVYNGAADYRWGHGRVTP
jgi:DNA replication protein DnaC